MYDSQPNLSTFSPRPGGPDGIDEAKLLSQLLADDDQAWRIFHETYSGVITRAITAVKNRFPMLIGREDVGEIRADLCLQLLSSNKRRLRSFDPTRGTPLGTWLGILARHAAYDFLRSSRRSPPFCWLGDELSRVEALVEDAPDAFRICCARERTRILSALLQDLSPRDQEFVNLYYCEGLDPEETAERLGICVGTVYSKKHKIRARIESLLDKRWAA
jgi:RNA polymerase sigma-70 factor (ECF subfamily)